MTRDKSPNNTTSKVAPEYKSFLNLIPQLSHRVPKGFRALELRAKQCRALTIIGLHGSRAARRKNQGSIAPLPQTRVPFSQNQQFCAGGRQARKRKRLPALGSKADIAGLQGSKDTPFGTLLYAGCTRIGEKPVLYSLGGNSFPGPGIESKNLYLISNQMP